MSPKLTVMHDEPPVLFRVRFRAPGSPLGHVTLTTSPYGLVSVDLDGNPEDSPRTEPATALEQVIFDKLFRYLAGEEVDFTKIPLDLQVGTPFQRAVWAALAMIPYGETRDYGWVARQVGSPKAVRAVGQANRANPVPIVVPCHRVIQASGGLGGYQGNQGLDKKTYLLALEAEKVSEKKEQPVAERLNCY